MLIKCDICDCDIFEINNAYNIESSEFRVFGVNEKLETLTKTIQYAKCIKCGSIKIPSTSIVGKNSLSPEVKLYGNFCKAVETQNNKTKLIYFINTALDSINNTLNDMKEQLLELLKKESNNVKTTKRSKKDTV
jgi:hypothetical protein